MTHFREECICGKVLTQCRCIGPHKVTITYPCTHTPVATTTVEVAKPFSFDEMALTYGELIKQKIPNKVKMSELTWEIFKYKIESGVLLDGTQPARVDPSWTLFGMEVKIDPKLKPGEWKFE